MFWAQALTSFAFWVGYGIFQKRRSRAIQKWAWQVSAARRGLAGAGLFLAGAALMFSGLMLVAANRGLGPSGFQPWAWIALTLTGLAFVHLQTLATALLVVSAQDAVTRERATASEESEPQKESSL